MHHVAVHLVARFDDPEDRRDGRGIHAHIRDIFDAHGDRAHVASGQRYSDDLIGSRIAQAVVDVAGQADDAVAGRPAVGRGLAGRLIHAFPNRLIALGAQVPVIDLVGYIATDRLAHVIKRDAMFIRREESIVGLGEHGGKGQAVAGLGMDDKFIRAAGKCGGGAIAIDGHSRDSAF